MALLLENKNLRNPVISTLPHAGKDWRQKEERGGSGWEMDTIADSVGSEQILEDREGQRRLVCCSPWGCRVRHRGLRFYPLFLAPSFHTFFIPLPFQIHPYSNLQQSLKELTIFLAHNFTFLAWICCTWAFFFDTFSYTPLLRKLLLSESTDVTAKPVLVHPWLSFSSCNRMTDSWFSHVS